MPVVVVGVNHRTAPIELLERLTVATDELAKALHDVSTYDDVAGAVVLSTCNRVEVYAEVTRFHRGAQELRDFLAEFRHVAPEEFSDHLYTYHDEGALRHLFRVAAGLDSMVVGESEILGQVRRAYSQAAAEGVAGSALGNAFRAALHAGKVARARDPSGRSPASIASAAVELALRDSKDGSLGARSVLVVGAGEVAGLALKALEEAGADRVTVVGRTNERATTLAAGHGARAVSFVELEDALVDADVIISSTNASRPVIVPPLVERAHERRPARRLIIDLAIPRDVDPAVGDSSDVAVLDLRDLGNLVDRDLEARAELVDASERVVGQELDRFLERERSTEAAPTVAALVAKAEEIRRVELRRAGSRLAALPAEQRETVELVTRRIVAKLLHTPVTTAKASPDSEQGRRYLAALRALFGIDDEEL